MKGEKRTCNNCGHDCHCYQPNCDECVNDVCVKCQCDRPADKQIPDSMLNGL